MNITIAKPLAQILPSLPQVLRWVTVFNNFTFHPQACSLTQSIQEHDGLFGQKHAKEQTSLLPATVNIFGSTKIMLFSFNVFHSCP